MSDYIMCDNQECMNAGYCRRQTDERKKRQQFKYFLNKGDECDHFIPNEKYKVFQILRGDGITQIDSLGNLMRRALGKSAKKI